MCDPQRPKTLAEVAREALEAQEEAEEVPSGPLQEYFQKVAKNPIFENGIICIILANCFTLAAFDPGRPTGQVPRPAAPLLSRAKPIPIPLAN